MSFGSRDLADAFPGNTQVIRALCAQDRGLRRLCDSFHAINRALERTEACVDARALRKQRLSLIVRIAARLG